jgi:arylsulfatase A-like enzyme
MARMNVIVVVCNGLHLGFLGAYGNSWIETPNLDRLATEAVVFDHHFPENLTTLPTRRSWWTGRYGFPDPDSGWTALRHDEPILPDLLWNQGVHSALISDVPLLRDAGQGFGRGWDEVIWVRGQGYDPLVPQGDPRAGKVRISDEPGLRLPDEDDPDYELWKGRWQQFLRNRAVLKTEVEENTGVARTVRAAIDWLERRTDDPSPFLIWLDLFSPHGPWDPPQPYRDQYAAAEPDEFEAGEEGDLIEEDDETTLEEVRVLIDVPAGAVGEVLSEEELLRLRRTYAGTVTLVDRWLGELFDALKAQGRLDDSLVVFTSDQGEPLGEHGYVRRFRPWLYEELIHTPLIVRLPKGEQGGSRRQAIVQTVDLLPTILAALGLPPNDRAHGHDLLPLLRGEQSKVRDYACLGMDVEEFAIRTHLWHLIVPIEVDPDEPRQVELYRKPEDRWDQNDVAAEHPEVADQLELTLRRFVDAISRDAIEDVPPLRDVARFNESD